MNAITAHQDLSRLDVVMPGVINQKSRDQSTAVVYSAKPWYLSVIGGGGGGGRRPDWNGLGHIRRSFRWNGERIPPSGSELGGGGGAIRY